ncbi:hypothetical protein ACI65C_012204 [Semiaphis heraclei]
MTITTRKPFPFDVLVLTMYKQLPSNHFNIIAIHFVVYLFTVVILRSDVVRVNYVVFRVHRTRHLWYVNCTALCLTISIYFEENVKTSK